MKSSKKSDLLLKKTVEKVIEKEISKWPPDCWGALYQPMRPDRTSQNKLRSDK